ncbi:hypothetical protein LTS08_004203 [Lithohypha guttulata]|nr:hypothetical protein LTS08_004203 [Lithohypha guttulata]
MHTVNVLPGQFFQILPQHMTFQHGQYISQHQQPPFPMSYQQQQYPSDEQLRSEIRNPEPVHSAAGQPQPSLSTVQQPSSKPNFKRDAVCDGYIDNPSLMYPQAIIDGKESLGDEDGDMEMEAKKFAHNIDRPKRYLEGMRVAQSAVHTDHFRATRRVVADAESAYQRYVAMIAEYKERQAMCIAIANAKPWFTEHPVTEQPDIESDQSNEQTQDRHILSDLADIEPRALAECWSFFPKGKWRIQKDKLEKEIAAFEEAVKAQRAQYSDLEHYEHTLAKAYAYRSELEKLREKSQRRGILEISEHRRGFTRKKCLPNSGFVCDITYCGQEHPTWTCGVLWEVWSYLVSPVRLRKSLWCRICKGKFDLASHHPIQDHNVGAWYDHPENTDVWTTRRTELSDLEEDYRHDWPEVFNWTPPSISSMLDKKPGHRRHRAQNSHVGDGDEMQMHGEVTATVNDDSDASSTSPESAQSKQSSEVPGVFQKTPTEVHVSSDEHEDAQVQDSSRSNQESIFESGIRMPTTAHLSTTQAQHYYPDEPDRSELDEDLYYDEYDEDLDDLQDSICQGLHSSRQRRW